MGTFLINEVQIFAIKIFPFTIGRQLSCNLVIQEPTVSRLHAQILQKGKDFYLEDLGSSGGTFLNGEKITFSKITTGDSILVSNIPLVFSHNKDSISDESERTTGELIDPSIDTNPTILNISYIWRPPKDQ